MSEEKFRVALFDGKNFDNWLFRLEAILDENLLLDYIKEDLSRIISGLNPESQAAQIAEHELNDKKCKSLIIRRIADSHLESSMP